MDYNFNEIEPKWRAYWQKNNTFKTGIDTHKPKYYVLDMFPYPSGAGLHVGHPLGYIASDIYSRYKRLKGFNVLHPMGYDAYGLPAEQYAIQTGQHPAITTEQNIKRYREQLDKIGFSFDWNREVRTSDPEYYKWTQWTFIQIFNSYYCYDKQQARPIAELIDVFAQQGAQNLNVACSEALSFTATEWNAKSEKEQQEILMNYRLAYLADIPVNWCPALGTVLANDEVVNGVSVRGGHPVERKLMRQWSLRITAYAERLLQGLENVEWTDSLKEIQRNWIGRSEGATMYFDLSPNPSPQERGAVETNNDSPQKKGIIAPESETTPCQNRVLFHTTDAKHWAKLEEAAKQYRSNQTEAEQALWQELRANKTGHKIRRQHIVDTFITDFISLDKGIVIEIDGGIHNTPDQKEYDEIRTQILNECGFEVIRFLNEEILTNPKNVAQQIKEYLDNKPSRKWRNTDLNSSTPLSCGEGSGERFLEIFTTRPDTIFGVTFMVICPEHEMMDELTTEEQKQAIEEYITWAKNRSERERQSEVKKVSGVFTGSYAIHPFSGEKIPIWVSEYVLAGYGSGAIMAVPAHDSRDFAFARHFNLAIVQVVLPTGEQPEDTNTWTESKDSKEGICINSDFITGMEVKKAITAVVDRLEEKGIGTRKINYRLHDAIFSRQRYWGEPFPIYYKDSMPYALPESELPLLLPEVDKYLPTESGEPPLARAKNWQTKDGYSLETSTMPGFAGSSAYYFRYMDPRNDQALVSTEAVNYWQNVDLYVGGAEHATGHLLYARFWNKFLFDIGLCPKDEPFQKLINQGMIQGRSSFVYRIKGTNKFVSFNLKSEYETDPLHVDINIVDNDVLDVEKFRKWMPEYAHAEFILEDGKYICGWEVEKMSKSLYNVQNPDDLIEKYGADTLRLYEMFLGPIEQAKPWDTKGIEGVARFIRKFWKLYHNAENQFTVSDAEPTTEELKVLHKTIKKIQQDIEAFSFNTSVSAFMICVNELSDLKCNKRSILEPLCILLSSFAPHISEELWQLLRHNNSITFTDFPQYDESVLVESTHTYPVSFNGKVRFNISLPADITAADAEKAVLENPDTQKWLEGKIPKKIIFVPKKILNVVM